MAKISLMTCNCLKIYLKISHLINFKLQVWHIGRVFVNSMLNN